MKHGLHSEFSATPVILSKLPQECLKFFKLSNHFGKRKNNLLYGSFAKPITDKGKAQGGDIGVHENLKQMLLDQL